MNLIIGALVVCVILGLWAPTRSKKVVWAVPLVVAALIGYYIVTHFNHL